MHAAHAAEPTRTRREVLAWSALLCVALCWGGAWTAGKIAVSVAPPFELLALRFAVAGSILALLARRSDLRVLGQRPRIVLGAALAVALNNAFEYLGLQRAPASDGALIAPLLVPVLTGALALFIAERLTRVRILGFAVASLGCALVVSGGQTSEALSLTRLLGDLSFAASALAWAVYSVLTAILLRSSSATAVAGACSLAAGIALVPFGWTEAGFADVASWTASTWVALAYVVAFSTIAGATLYARAVHDLGPTTAASAVYWVPIAAIAIAFVVLGERPSTLQLVGGVVSGLGVALTRP